MGNNETALTRIKNLVFSVNPFKGQKKNRDISDYIFREQLQRTRQDIVSWRNSAKEAENAYYPHRYLMQQLYIDTVLNGHVSACMSKRKSLVLKKKFGIYNKSGEKVETDLFSGTWFKDFISYTIDADFYGYSLITIGDIYGGKVSGVSIVRRANVSPDRLNVANHLRAISGTPFMEGELSEWTVYVKTPTETGASPCGYGILYKVALYEIFCRNLLGFNGDFIELFAQPYRVGKTTKKEGAERDALYNALENMGSSGFAVIDPDDSIEFLATSLGGTGFQGYDNLEKRCEAKISKLILGHADAMDSTPGKLGSTDGENNPVNEALESIESEDISTVEDIVNGVLFPKLKALGVKVPDGVFKFDNNKEIEEHRRKVDESNKKTAEIAQIMAGGGLQMSAEYFEERTGIPTKSIETGPAPLNIESTQLSARIKNKLSDVIYVK